MCGLFARYSNKPIPKEYPLLDLIKHRGPDGWGEKQFNFGEWQLYLGHTRLSVIDLTYNALQPLKYDDKYWIIFNGEIFNYIEIKSELEKLGHLFKTRSDTEVILAAYQQWGDACLKMFNGMFAFVIYDSCRQRLFCARDRFGIKPLYFMQSDEGLVVASELKQFIKLPGFSGKLNNMAAKAYLDYGDLNLNDETMLEGVYEVVPGNYFYFSLNGSDHSPVRQTVWYESDFYAQDESITYEEALAKFQYLFEDSIRLRMRSDVELGVMLSGGLDSSSISCMMKKIFYPNKTLKTYTAHYGDAKFDELKYSNPVVKECEADSQKVLIKPEILFEILDKAIWYNDLPLTASSILGHFQLYQSLPPEAPKVIFEGQGGDEILCGYDSFYWVLFCEYLKTGNYAKCFIEYLNYRTSHWGNPLRDFRRFLQVMNYNGKMPKNNLINPFPHDPESSQTNFVPRFCDSIQRLHEKRFTILRTILHSVDRVSMSSGRETRTPFLDYRLVEFCLSLPKELKINGKYSKKILRRAVAGIVPSEICYRKSKMGFRSPEKKWTTHDLAPNYLKSLTDIDECALFDKNRLIHDFSEVLKRKQVFSNKYWRVINFDRWKKIFKIRS